MVILRSFFLLLICIYHQQSYGPKWVLRFLIVRLSRLNQTITQILKMSLPSVKILRPGLTMRLNRSPVTPQHSTTSLQSGERLAMLMSGGCLMTGASLSSFLISSRSIKSGKTPDPHYILTSFFSRYKACKLRVFFLSKTANNLDEERKNLTDMLARFRISYSEVCLKSPYKRPVHFSFISR